MLEQIVDDEQVAVVFPQCVQDAGDAPGYGGWLNMLLPSERMPTTVLCTPRRPLAM